MFMNLRPKTKRRLIVLLTAATLIGGGGAAIVTVRLHNLDQRQQAIRDQAMVAFSQGNYLAAMNGLKKYLSDTSSSSANSTDADAIYAFAVSRSKIPRADLGHLIEAKANFNRYLELRPGDSDAQHQLLDIYTQLGYESEAQALADSLLASNPNDIAALSAKVRATIAQSKFDQALELSRKLNDLSPLDFSQQAVTLELMSRTKQPPQAIVARADALLKVHPDDPRFELLRAVAANFTGDSEGTRKWLLSACERPQPDAHFTQQLADVLDRAGLYEQAGALLEKSAAQHTDNPAQIDALVRREWEAEQYDLALAHLPKLEPNDPTADSALLGDKALLLYSRLETAAANATTLPSDARTEADAIVAVLSKRADDNTASSWATLLQTRFANPAMDPKVAIKQYQTLTASGVVDALAHYFMGFSYRDLGETELALQSWRQAGLISGSWAAPHLLMAQTLLSSGRVDEAVLEAQAAADRAPQSVEVRVTQAVATYAQLDPKASPDQTTRLLQFVQAVQTQVPNEPQTLPMYVALLSNSGRRDDAIAVIQKALAAQPELDAQTLVKLAQVSHENKLDQESAIVDLLGKSNQIIPQSALDRAILLANMGKPVDGLQFIVSQRDTIGNNSPDWQLAVVRFRDAIGDPGTVDAWALLADTNPNNLQVQQAVLRGGSTWSNRALIDRTIDRLKSLTGDEGIEWRLDRARWLLSSDTDQTNNANAAAASMAEVVRLAPSLPQPLVIWAHALERLGNPSGAIDRLRTASTLAPANVDIAIYLSRLLAAQGKSDDARDVLVRIVQSATISGNDRMRLARVFAQQGQITEAIDLLKHDNTGEPDPQRDLLLAQLYQAQGQDTASAALYDGLLKLPDINPTLVIDIARFYMEYNDPDKAHAALAKLNDLKLAPGMKELSMAAFSENYESSEKAIEQYRAATLAAPADNRTWKALAGYYLRHGNIPQATAVVDAGLKAIANDGSLLAMKQRLQTIATLPETADLQQILLVLSTNPTDEPATATLDAVFQSESNHENREQAIARLADVAGKYPRSMVVQIIFARRNLEAGHVKESQDIAQRAMAAMPNDPEPAQLLTGICAACGQWDRELAAANEWRNCSLDHPTAADLEIARGKLHLNDATGAITQLTPYLPVAKADPDNHAAVIELYAQALAQLDRGPDVQTLLQPLVKESAQWRALWLEIGVGTAKDSAAATAWIDQIKPLMPPDSKADQLALATAWYNIGERFRDNTAFAKARDLLVALCKEPDATAAEWSMLGSTQQELNNPTGAENSYRKALAVQPNLPMAENNLAYALLTSGGDMGEAQSMAEKAVAQSPDNSAYNDTLARIYIKTGKTDQAITGFQAAVHNDPNNLEALVGLADAQERAGQHDKASATLDQLDPLLKSNPPLADPIRQELEAVRSSLKRPAQTTSMTEVK
jgi:cellulose synthase operon protein C